MTRAMQTRSRSRTLCRSARWFGLLLSLALLSALAPQWQIALADQPTPGATPASTSDWRTSGVSLTPEAPAAGDVVSVRFNVVDADGAPVPHLNVVAALRPATTTTNGVTPPDPILSAVGRELTTAGSYEVSVAVNQVGSWWLAVTAGDGLRQASFSRLLNVDPIQQPTTRPNNQDPIFLQGDAVGAYFRLDPQTGSVARLSGEAVSEGGGKWWVTATHLTATESPDPLYGGTWNLRVSFADALLGTPVSTVDLGNVRAAIYLGSTDQPAIATALALAPDGSRAFVYWARQLGAGWTARVAAVDPHSGEILGSRVLTGEITGDDQWASLTVSPDGRRLLVAEQVVQGASVVGFRLTRLDADSLATISQVRRTSAAVDPLTRCLIPFPGPVGALPGSNSGYYSLCTPPDTQQPALITWDATNGTVTHRVDLSALVAGSTSYVDGVASPDGRHFYAVNTVTRQVADIDLASGRLLRTISFAPDPKSQSPSGLRGFFDWLLGAIQPPDAAAGILIRHGVAIAPDGGSLYVVSPAKTSAGGFGDGIWELDTHTLEVSQHLLGGTPVAGVVVAASGQLAVVENDQQGGDSQITVVQPNGQLIVSLTLPDSLAAAVGAH